MKSIKQLLLIIGLLIMAASLAVAQDGNPFELLSASSQGGGGQSQGGSFAVHGSVESSQSQAASGGNFNATSSLWTAVCPQPSSVTAPIAQISNQHLQLSWTSTAPLFYIYRSINNHYFLPSTLYATAETASWQDPDQSAVGNPTHHYTYLIFATNACGQSEMSQRIGTFAFAITPGN